MLEYLGEQSTPRSRSNKLAGRCLNPLDDCLFPGVRILAEGLLLARRRLAVAIQICALPGAIAGHGLGPYLVAMVGKFLDVDLADFDGPETAQSGLVLTPVVLVRRAGEDVLPRERLRAAPIGRTEIVLAASEPGID